MTYTARVNKSQDIKTFKDKENNVWEYITPSEYKKLSKENKRICADMRAVDSNSIDRVLEKDQAFIGLYRYNPSIKWNEKVVGYIPVSQENEFVTSCCVRIVAKSNLKAASYIFALLILMLAMVFVIFKYIKEDENKPTLDETAVAYRVDGMVNEDPSKIMMPLITDMTASKDSTHMSELLLNPEGNQCYFKFQIILDENDEIIYESDYVLPGKAILKFNLKRPLSVGEHNATVKILARDLDDVSKTLNGGDMKTVIKVSE